MLSETPSCQPWKTMMETTVVTMKATERTEVRAWIMFVVAAKRMMNEKKIAMNMPDMAPRRNSLSEAAQAREKPPLNFTFYKPSGAVSL